VVPLLVAAVPADLRSVPLLCAADDWPLEVGVEVEADLLPSVLTEAVPLELLLPSLL
jgi:hypothetical protein